MRRPFHGAGKSFVLEIDKGQNEACPPGHRAHADHGGASGWKQGPSLPDSLPSLVSDSISEHHTTSFAPRLHQRFMSPLTRPPLHSGPLRAGPAGPPGSAAGCVNCLHALAALLLPPSRPCKVTAGSLCPLAEAQHLLSGTLPLSSPSLFPFWPRAGSGSPPFQA